MSLFDCLSSLPTLLTASTAASTPRAPPPVDLLLLGSGWTSSFVLPLAQDAGLRVASTTRAGSTGGSIQWTFDADASDEENAQSFRVLPDAQTVLVVFPLYDEGAAERLVRGYLASRCGGGGGGGGGDDGGEKQCKGIEDADTRFILLGSTGIYDNGPTLTSTLAPLSPAGGQAAAPVTARKYPQQQQQQPYSTEKDKKKKKKPGHGHDDDPSSSPWITSSSPYFALPRALAEDAFLALSHRNNAIRSTPIATTVLLLCGLWGHGRSARNLIARLPASKDVFRNLASVHLVHGRDVARAVLAMHRDFQQAMSAQAPSQGRRWILTNGRVYDLWDLAAQFGDAGEAGRNHAPRGEFPRIVGELLNEGESSESSEGSEGSEGEGQEHGPHALPRSAETMFDMTKGASRALDGREFWRVFGLQPEVGWVD